MTENEERKEAWEKINNVNNKLCGLACLIDPDTSDHKITLDFTGAIGVAQILKDCVDEICAAREILEEA